MSSDLTDLLTVKERAFCEAYCSNGGNATRAYIQGGYAANSDQVAGSESFKLLKKPKIQAYVKYLQASVSKRFDISADRLVQELASIAFANPKEIFDDDGEMLPISQIPDHCLGALQEVQVETTTDRRGNITIKLWCPVAARPNRQMEHRRVSNDSVFKDRKNP